VPDPGAAFFVEGLPTDVMAVAAVGKVTHADYRDVLRAMVTMFRPFFHGDVRLFALSALAGAEAWIAAAG
jgi:hypothetical protein